jgi:DNA-binding transcriptional ArsR family regulator
MAEQNYRGLERIVKGFANHRRLQILDLLKREPELSVDDISEKLNIGYENASDHIRKMTIAGLLLKRSDGPFVRHKLTPRADIILAFCKKLQ